jgi:hypothetical protein
MQDSKHPFIAAHLEQTVSKSVTNDYDSRRQVPTRIIDGTFDLDQHCFLAMWPALRACQHKDLTVTIRNNLPLQVSDVLPLSASSTAATVAGLSSLGRKSSFQPISRSSDRLCAGQLRKDTKKRRQYREKEAILAGPCVV